MDPSRASSITVSIVAFTSTAVLPWGRRTVASGSPVLAVVAAARTQIPSDFHICSAHCGIFYTKLFQVGFVVRRVEAQLFQFRPESCHSFPVQIDRRGISLGHQRLPFPFLGLLAEIRSS